MATKTLDHPALDQLAATPDIFRALLGRYQRQAGVLETQLRTAFRSPNCWNICRTSKRIVSESVSTRYWRRTTQRSNRTTKTLTTRKARTQIAMRKNRWRIGRNSGRTTSSFCGASIRRSCRERRRHTVLGQFTLENLLNEWALHDLGHVRQLAELVRAQLYYPEIGPFRVEYTLKP